MAHGWTAPKPLRLEVDDDPAADDIARLDDHVAAFTVAATGHGDTRPLAVFARDDGALLGGIHGWTWGRCCELVALWVAEPLRGRGLGRGLLAAAEREARTRGCRQVVLFTHDVQAPRLYILAGYELVGELPDFPAGSTAYWFRKRLDPLRRLDQRSREIVRHVTPAALWVVLMLLAAGEIADGIRALRRHTVRGVATWWDGVERHERRDVRRTEIGLLTRRLGRRATATVRNPRRA